MNDDMEQCIRNCSRCHEICVRAAQAMLGQGDAKHLTLMLVCADICRVSADTMLRGYEQHGIVCGACGQICERCAQACETHAANDTQMRACAEACRRCAESCARMARTAA